MTSAAVPATNGDAIDVPEMTTLWLPLPTSVDVTASPGAAMSGLSSASNNRGPPDEKLAVPVWVGVPAAIPMDTPSRATSAEPSEFGLDTGPRTPMNAMLTVKLSPVSGFVVMGPSKGGRSGLLLIIATAAAPAC